jgi:protein-S-isoprenylcysteine O-methyltransferase Ste14
MRYQWYELVFLVGLVIYIYIRGRFIRRIGQVERVVRRGDWQDRALLILVAIGNLLLPIVYLATPLLRFADYRLPWFAPWIGSVLLIAALRLFWQSHVDLGENWSVTLEIRKDHELVTDGVYRWIRHPMYAAIMLFGLAQALLLPNWLAGWFALATFLILYIVRTPREERMMCDVFGDQYRAYMRRTGRVIPRFGDR